MAEATEVQKSKRDDLSKKERTREASEKLHKVHQVYPPKNFSRG